MSQQASQPTAPLPPPPPPVPDDVRQAVIGDDSEPTSRRGFRSWLARRSLRTRVGALAAAGVGLAVALTALAGYLTVANQLQASTDTNLLARAQQAVTTSLGNPDQIVRVPSEALLAADIRVALFRSDRTAYNATGDARTAPPLGEAELAVARGSVDQSVRSAWLDGERYRVVAVPTGTDGVALVLAQSTEQTERILDRLRIVSFVVGGAGIVLAAWAGVSIARAGIRPVRRLTEAAEHVAATGRLDPIEVEGSDELARLAHSFNAMLTALADAQRRQSQLVADAGHELRTPLTSMRTNLDLLAQSERQGGLDSTERAALISDARAQAEELTQLVGDLIELSREDPPKATREQLDLADLVHDALTRVRRRAPGITFVTELEPWPMLGDPALLGRAVTNLLDNAAKYSPPDGTVTVGLHEGTLEVSDQGPGIADEDRPHVFERFYRSSEARSLPGSGLGLAIVKAAADRHGGSVRADRAESGGARLTLRLPAELGGPGRQQPSSAPLA